MAFAREAAVAVDEGGLLMGALLRAQASIKSRHSWVKRAWEVVSWEDRIAQDEDLSDGIARYFCAAVELHNCINSLRWAIAEHDAAYAKVTGSFDTPEELTTYLDALDRH